MPDQATNKDQFRKQLETANLQIAELQSLNANLQERLEQYQIIFDLMNEGFALCEMIYDDRGAPVDFRYLRVNPAFAKQTGISINQVIGKTVKQIVPGVEPFWISTYNRIVRTGKSETIAHSVAEWGKHFEVKAWRSGPGRFGAIFTDITERKQIEELIKFNASLKKSRDTGHKRNPK